MPDPSEASESELQFKADNTKRESGWISRRIMILLGAIFIIVVVGFSLWYWIPRIAENRAAAKQRELQKLEKERKAAFKKQEKERKAALEKKVKEQIVRTRARLEGGIRQRAEKLTADAGEDWPRVIEIENWRDQLLADLNRNLARIEETLLSEGSTASYRKAVDTLEMKGVGEALAYLQSGSAKREETIKSQTSQGQRKDAQLRELLKESLLEAYLLETMFQFDEAETKFRAVVKAAEKWPQARNDLARFLIQRGMVMDSEKGNEKLLEAANLCLRTLTFTERKDSERDWAMTQNNIGMALSSLGIRSGGSEVNEGRQQLEVAAAAYRSALEVMTPEHLPMDWATTQDNLGTVLSDLGIRSSGSEGRQQLEAAVEAYRRALEVRTKKESPKDWAMTQNSLGNVLSNLGIRSGETEGREQLEAAVKAYKNALEVRTREKSPEDWATTQNNLGTVLADLGTRSRGSEGKEQLEAAVAAYRSALEVRTRDNLPQDWATTLNNLVDALTELAGVSAKEDREKLLEEAANGYETLIAASQEQVIEKSAAAGYLGDFSFFKLRRNDASGALEAANKALEADPNQIWIKTNLVTAHLLLDEWEEAENLLNENALKVPYGEEPFWQLILNDFDELKKFGVSHPNIKRMREYIVAHYNPETDDDTPAKQSE